jgi:hypothetical protein
MRRASGDDDDQGLTKSAVIASTIGSIPRPMMTPTVQAASLSSSGLNRLRMAKPSSQRGDQYGSDPVPVEDNAPDYRNGKSAAELILAQENSISRNLRDSRQFLLFSSKF